VLITVRDVQIKTFEQQSASDFKDRLARDAGIESNAALDTLIADAKACGITSEADVAQLVASLQAGGSPLSLKELPKSVQTTLLARGIPPAVKLTRLDAALAAGAGSDASPAERNIPLPTHYAVRDGDCIVSISFAFGFFTETIWDHPENKKLRDLRQDMHVLSPGDSVFIPAKREKEESRDTDAKHRFRLKGVPKRLRVQFQSFEKPQANLGYSIRFQSREERGKTDADGWLEHFIPPGLLECTIRLDDGSEYSIALGTLNPATEAAGIQDRLAALGYYESEITGVWDAPTRLAIQEFQSSHALPPSGDMDDTTRALLVSLSGA
jgi:hypothetical protein